MNLEQYLALMDPELRVAFEQILPLFLNMPEDPVAVRKLMEQLPLPERQQSERVMVEDRMCQVRQVRLRCLCASILR